MIQNDLILKKKLQYYKHFKEIVIRYIHLVELYAVNF